MALVEAVDLVKNFRDIQAVQGVSLEVREGEIFGFLGPNGAGKSTTIKMLCTLLRPTSGRAVLAGFDVLKQPNQVRRQIGLVFQETTLDDRLTARENLYFHALLYGVPAAEREERMQKVLEMVELVDRQRHQVRTFSGGMKRRLEIARGLIHYPRLLFLDEPTVGLDPQTRNHIWGYIRQLKEKEGLTIFLTTHYMDEAENCDRIAIIDHGRIVAQDTPERLKQMVRGDLITIQSADNGVAAERLREIFGLEARLYGDALQVEVEAGESFIPRLVREIGLPIRSVGLSRPTLDDVFLKLTGHAIREEGPANWPRGARGWRHA